jgi:dual specificity MAP kinase phosphatase
MSFITEMRRLYLHFKYQGAKKGMLAAYDKLARYVTGGPLTRFCRVTGELWIGGQPRGAGMKTLRSHGITAVVNMRSEYDYPELAKIHELKYLRLPTEDNGTPTLADLAKGVEFMTDEIEGGGRVYVHCWEGIGRSATMAAAYLVSKGSTPEQAWKKIRKVRPFIQPTAAQIKCVEEYAVLYF